MRDSSSGFTNEQCSIRCRGSGLGQRSWRSHTLHRQEVPSEHHHIGVVREKGFHRLPQAHDGLPGPEVGIGDLHETYGAGRPELARRLAPLNTMAAGLASGVRPRGRRVRAPRETDPAQLLELYQYEACPACRRVRERLHELDLPFLVRTVAHRSPGRARLRSIGGRVRVPFLVDPNTGESMYESDDIVKYLDDLYG